MSIPLKFARLKGHRYCTIPVPISAETRVASIGRNRIQAGRMRRFSTERWPQIETFQPNVLLGRTADLQRLANLADAEIIDLSSVDTALLVSTGFGDMVISDVERVVLWQTFGVPVYELLLSADGHLLGSECEAHSGWHIEPDARLGRTGSNLTLSSKRGQPRRLGIMAQIETEPCACGREEPRIVIDGRPRLVRVLAATA
jgi:hypothetical protein